MKKLFLFLSIMMVSLHGLNAQTITTTISGTIINSINSAPIANQAVYIVADTTNSNFNYYAVVYTNANGFYSDTLVIPSTSPITFYVTTANCNGGVEQHTVVSSNLPMVSNFTLQCPNLGCTANFTATPDSLGNGLTYNFYDQSNPINGNIIAWSWNFGDGSTSSNLQYPSHTYNTIGFYNVCLSIATSTGCTAQHCDSIFVDTVNSNACHASFQFTVNNASVSFYGYASAPGSSFHWDFDDNSTSNLQAPIHNYNVLTTYHVCLTISTPNGCTSTYCTPVTTGIPTQCNAGFQAVQDSLNPLSYHFISTSTGVISSDTYLWTFGDGGTSTNFDPHHLYTSLGTFSICLNIYDSLGNISCTYCDSMLVDTAGPLLCHASFQYAVSGNNVTFFGSAGANVASFTWSFGDGVSATGQYQTHAYSGNGPYTVCLYITTPSGCSDTHCENITLNNNGGCSASFSAAPDTLNPLSIHFKSTSTGVVTGDTYSWTFGDGGTSTNFDPHHTYANAGNYVVCLSILDSIGNISCTYCDSVTVVPAQACHASFTYSVSGHSVAFYAMSNTNVASFTWSFGDSTSGTGLNPTHNYSGNGPYTVCLYIATQGGCTSSYCVNIILNNNGGCSASFSAVPDTLNPLSIHFKSTSTGVVTGDTYSWTFGDGGTSTNFDPHHTYANAGNYVVCLSILDSLGNISCTYCDSITVGPAQACHASFTYTVSGHSVAFYDVSNTNVVSFTWSFGDGTSGTGPDPAHTYSGNGPYTICLYITTQGGCTSSYCENIMLNNNGACSAVFHVAPDTLNPLTVHFINISSGVITGDTYAWSFGDGTSSTNFDPQHTYANAGTYNVCLDIIDSMNMVSCSYCDSVTVGSTQPCHAYFTYIISGNSVHFVSIASSNVTTYYWNFGDGSSSTLISPTHQYANPGTYHVCLTINSLNGCTNTYCQDIVIGAPGNASICGQVFAGVHNADVAYVLLVAYDSLNNTYFIADTTMVDSTGHYCFNSVPAGNYIIVTFLTPNSAYFGNFIPTYYGDVDTWSTATFINVASGASLNGYNIHLIYAPNANNGGGYIGGNVVFGWPKGPGAAVEGVEILLTDINDVPLASTFSNSNGSFHFDNLAYATYKVSGEVPGLVSAPAFIKLDASNTTVSNVLVTVFPHNIAASVNDVFSDYITNVGALYPNPASDKASIEVTLKKATSITVGIFNIMGQQTASFSVKPGVGKTTIPVSLSKLAAGVYTLQFTTQDGTKEIRKFTKIN